ncbi:MAG TPA: S8 family serine peptidase [Vicinamibacterales bacterium]|nr:S8 family serine peptidase [Vicinamibacterales bacterium]
MTRHRAAFTTCFVVCALAALFGAAQDPRAVGGSQIPGELRQRAALDGRVRVLVELKLPTGPHVAEGASNPAAVVAQRAAISAAAARVLARLQSGGHRVLHQYVTVPYIALEVSAANLEALDNSAQDVIRVMDDPIVRPVLAQSVPLIEGDQAWASGYDGSGNTIAVLDTGVDSTHPFLSGKVIEEACYSSTVSGSSQTFCPNGLNEQIGPGSAVPCPLADCIHGTHVAGIAAGNGDQAGQPFSGVAKGAHLMAVQVFSEIFSPLSCGGAAPCAGAYSSDIIAGLERVYSVAGDRQIVAVNMSLGGGAYSAPCDDQPYKPIIDNLRSIGVATVVAAGNNGSSSSLSTPGCISSAISVGSTDKNDVVSWFSNVASFMSLFAPGESILSSVPGGGYDTLSGTSMATPHVAGAWAVLRQAAPGASVSTILSALQDTGLPIADTRLFGTETKPRVRIFRALATFVAVTNPSPAAASVSPPRVRAGMPFTVTVTGTGFDSFSVLQWNGAAKPTTVVSTTQLRAAISAADVAAAGTGLVSVFTPAPGGGISSSLPVIVDPPPTLTVNATTIGPNSPATVTLNNGFGGSTDWLALAAAGSPDTSYLQWTYVGPGVTERSWTVTMPSTAGTYEFRLFLNNGSTRAATSPAVTVDTTFRPLPVVTSLSPARAIVGGSAVTLAVNGSNFTSSSVVRWNGADRPTTFVNASQLQAAIGSGDIAAVGTAQVTVFTPAPGGGTSAPVAFTISPPPALSVSAATVQAGASVTATLTGGLGGPADWLALASTTAPNTVYVQYVYVGAGVFDRTWTVAMPSTPGTYEFRLFLNGGYTRGATSPTITVSAGPNPAPTLTSISPATSPVGAGAFSLTANGSGFVSSSVVRWNGADRVTTFVSSTQLRAAISAADVAAAGTAQVSVFNPSPGGGLSSPLPFGIVAGSAALSASATTVPAGTSVTATLTNGFGGSTDWLALAATGSPDSSYLLWTYVGAGVTTRTWTVTMPSTAGTYEFRLFLNNGYARVATSPAVTVTPGPNPVPALSSTSPVASAAGAGSFTLTVNGSGFVSSSIVRWNGADRITTFVSATQLRAAIPATDVAAAGTAQVTVFSPAPGGGVSAALPFNVGVTPTLSVSATTAAPGSSVTVTLTNGFGGSTDWLGFASTSAPDTSYLNFVYVGAGVTTRTWTVTMPSTPGTYQFRLFPNNGYTRAATSPTVTVVSQ